MKVGLMIPSLFHGGAERAICRLSDIFAAAGYEVYLIVFDASKKYYSFSGQLVDLQLPDGGTPIDKMRVLWRRVKAVKNIKDQYNLEVVISFMAAATFVNTLAKSSARCIVSQRNFMSKETGNKLKKKLLQYCFKNADAVVAVAELCRLDLIENFNVPVHKVHTIYNAYDQLQISKKMEEKIEENHQTFFDRPRFNLVSVARPEYQKGFWNLVKVLYLVREKGVDCGLTIVGEGSQLSKLEKLSHALGLKEHVKLVGYQSNPYAYIGRSDLYVMTSLFEGFPNALTEAMCCGKPIISTDCPSGPREILQGKEQLTKKADRAELCEYGILVPVFSERENWEENQFDREQEIMAETICEVLGNELLRKKLGVKAQERAASFSYHSCLKAYEQLF
ncbi:glycosyltransferase [Bacillus sp. UNC41MFS5]|uniref:glycosyltransferase n=1 Tax=Bacillus sp. UNC41MFS5 TaxID=1449046 RepID=UPI00047D7940|nr:glycosyltransferase [Bacillus sp. UNC41MFS5]